MFKPLQCDTCKKRFGDPSNLNKHLKMIHGETKNLHKTRSATKKSAKRLH